MALIDSYRRIKWNRHHIDNSAGKWRVKKVTDPGSTGPGQATFGGRGDDPDHAFAVYEKHNYDVRSTFSSDRLLVCEFGSGWTPLCEFPE